MKQALTASEVQGMRLVKIAYGNDDDTKAAQETQALLHAYPNLRGIISPTLVGVVAAARVLTRAHECGKVALAGLGLPSQMRSYIKSGCAKVGFWDEFEFGYVAEYVAHNVLTGKLTGKAGQTFTAGKLGKRTVGPEPDGHLWQALGVHQGNRRQVQLLRDHGTGRVSFHPAGGLIRQTASVRVKSLFLGLRRIQESYRRSTTAT